MGLKIRKNRVSDLRVKSSKAALEFVCRELEQEEFVLSNCFVFDQTNELNEQLLKTTDVGKIFFDMKHVENQDSVPGTVVKIREFERQYSNCLLFFVNSNKGTQRTVNINKKYITVYDGLIRA